MTPKQKLQKDRAYFKFVLAGLPKPIRLESLSEHERKQWNEILLIRKSILDQFDWNSKNLGLNVQDKCWCGKIAKYEPIGYPEHYHITRVCKKHINYD